MDTDAPDNAGALLAVIVLSHGPRPSLPAAVRSLLGQDVPLELLVVHTGPGDVQAMLAAEGLPVPVLTDPVPRYVGAARNLGVAHTRAPYVAFLADDCLAAPGWAAARIQAHQQGALAVASALLPTRLQHPVALASFLCRQIRRLPRTPEDSALRYGLSYRRTLFEAIGPFREDILGGEDSVFNRQVKQMTDITWEPAVVTLHAEPTSLRGAIADSFRRGKLNSSMRRAMGEEDRSGFFHRTRYQIKYILNHARSRIEPESRGIYPLSVPLIVLFVAAYQLGVRREKAVFRKRNALASC